MSLHQEPDNRVVDQIRSRLFQAKFMLHQEPDHRVVDQTGGIQSEDIGGMEFQGQFIGTEAQEKERGSCSIAKAFTAKGVKSKTVSFAVRGK